MRLSAWLSLLLLSHLESIEPKKFDPCEFAQELTRDKYNISFWQIPTWVCLGYHGTGLDSSYSVVGYHGIFRISGRHWCGQCNITCDKLSDEDLTDDVQCAAHIYERNNNEKNNGFNAWGTLYTNNCLEPWEDLQGHDCHKYWKMLLLRLPKRQLDHHRTTESPFKPITVEIPSMPEEVNGTDPPSSTSDNKPEHHEGWAVHNLLETDSGILILILLLVFIVAGLIEIWRRNELPLSNMFL